MTVVEPENCIDPEDLREAASRFLADRSDRRASWEGRDDGRAGLEEEMRALGWHLLTVPEANGGLGQAFDALAPIYEELGRVLSPVWLSGTMAAVDALMADGGGAAEASLAGIAEKSWRVATVIVPAGAAPQSATLPMVGGADSATHLLMIAGDGSVARLLPIDAHGVAVKPVGTWDLGRGYADVVLNGAQTLGVALDGAKILPVARAHLELALAWDCIGGASQCLSETIDYMQGRQQFGRPIASFQALKHRAADHKVGIELARSLVSLASKAFANRTDGWSTLATQACILAGDAFSAMAEDAVQLHGGVGFTWEYNCHLFLKRALANQIIGGSPDELRDRVAADVAARAMGLAATA